MSSAWQRMTNRKHVKCLANDDKSLTCQVFGKGWQISNMSCTRQRMSNRRHGRSAWQRMTNLRHGRSAWGKKDKLQTCQVFGKWWQISDMSSAWQNMTDLWQGRSAWHRSLWNLSICWCLTSQAPCHHTKPPHTLAVSSYFVSVTGYGILQQKSIQK